MAIDMGRRPVNRRFMVILALSLLLHGSLLFWQLKARKQIPALPPILATLRLSAQVSPSEPLHPKASPPALARPVPAVPQKVRQPSASPEVAPPRERVMAAAPTTASRPAVVAATPASAVPVNATPVHATPAQAAPAEPEAPAAAPGPAQRDLLAAYRRQLGELFSRHQRYPRIAAMRGWEGEVRVRLKVARKGSLLLVQLDRSSGFDVLDQHALAMLGDLPALPALPEGLATDELQLVVPILYTLNKTS